MVGVGSIVSERNSAYYEEYCAERFSSILCNTLLTQRSERSIEDQNVIYSGHHENVSSVAQGLIQIRNSVEELKNHGRGDRFLQDVKPMTESLLMSYFYLIAFRKEIPSDENEAKYRLPYFFHQTDFRDVATLFHDRFPHPLPAGEAIRAIKNIYGHFGSRSKRGGLRRVLFEFFLALLGDKRAVSAGIDQVISLILMFIVRFRT